MLNRKPPMNNQRHTNPIFARLAAGMVALAGIAVAFIGMSTTLRNPRAAIDGGIGAIGGALLLALAFLILIRNRVGYTIGILLGAMIGPAAGWPGTHTTPPVIILAVLAGLLLIFLVVSSWRNDCQTIRPFAKPVDGKY